MHATQQQTFNQPRTALAAVVLAIAFSTGTALGLAIGISGPKLATVTAAAPIGDRSYDAIEQDRAREGALIVAGDRSYDRIEGARAGSAKTGIGGDRSYRGLLDEGTGRGDSAPARTSSQAPRSHGPLEFD